MRNLLIVLLVIVTLVLGRALVRVENARYALWLGMCPNMRQMTAAIGANSAGPDALACTKTIQTRTGWWWHLYYAVTDNG
ncbi:hypothetical protein [Burkholderia multivorans]|uniref:hypothetical protein n=1 Tax=Burkholderia multivorans TaxID=87883 RepID=UPI00158C1508|nr:hypothetical protein [Burkholderia multivorans]